MSSPGIHPECQLCDQAGRVDKSTGKPVRTGDNLVGSIPCPECASRLAKDRPTAKLPKPGHRARCTGCGVIFSDDPSEQRNRACPNCKANFENVEVVPVVRTVITVSNDIQKPVTRVVFMAMNLDQLADDCIDTVIDQYAVKTCTCGRVWHEDAVAVVSGERGEVKTICAECLP